MPREITTKDEVEKLLPEVREIRLVRGKMKKNDEGEKDKNKDDETNPVKLKLRTERTLYTFKTTEEEAQALIKGQKIDVVEF
jgi:hypothetical protein